MILRKTFRFEASHILPGHPGKCRRLHGHSWVLNVFVEGPINPQTGFVVDYATISEYINPLIDRLDHHHLGQWVNPDKQTAIPTDARFTSGLGTDHMVLGMPPTFYPSSENLLVWIAGQIIILNWSKLAIEETCTSYAELTRQEYDSVSYLKGPAGELADQIRAAKTP